MDSDQTNFSFMPPVRHLGTALLLMLTAVGCGVVSNGVQIAITNKTGGNITDIRLDFTGGVVSPEIIKDGDTYTARVNPTGDSHLELRYRDGTGTEHSERFGVYFEHGSSGRIVIEVWPAGRITLKDDTHV